MRDPNLILRESQTVAIVGISADPKRDSHQVAAYLMHQGYRIFPVNPGLKRVLGLDCYPSLLDLPNSVDIVDVFRRSEHAAQIAEDTVAIGAKALWLQLGVVNQNAWVIAQAAGLDVIMDQCTMAVHRRLIDSH